MKKIATYLVLLFMLTTPVFSQSRILTLTPDSDVNSNWRSLPSSGSLFTKIDDPLSFSGDDDYIYKDEGVVGYQQFTFKDPPGNLVVGDVVVNVRASLLNGFTNLQIEVIKNGFTIATINVDPDYTWENFTVYVATKATRATIAQYEVQVTNGGCTFYPTCTVAISAINMEISNAKFRMDTP